MKPFRSLCDVIRSWRTDRRERTAPRSVPRLRCEPLEDRSVPAALGFGGGMLVYTAGAGVANQLAVSYSVPTNTFTFQDSGELIHMNGSPNGVGTATVSAQAVSTVLVYSLDRADTVQILGTKPGAPLVVYAGTGDDDVHAGNATTTLSGILGPVGILGQDGFDELFVNDYAAQLPPQTYEVNSTQVTRAGIAGVGYNSEVEQVRLNAGTNNDTVYVRSTAATATTVISLKSGDDDQVIIGSAAGSLDTILGLVNVGGDKVSGGGPRDTVVVNDAIDTSANTYDVAGNTDASGSTYTQVVRNGQLLLNGGTLKSLTLNAGSANDLVNVKGFYVPVTVNAGGGGDTIRMYPDRIFAPVVVNGQGGGDTLDYSLHADEVYVNLTNGWKSTDVDWVTGVENVTGGQSDDVLVGDGGTNVLRGSAGNDILIGGLGRDVLDGDLGDDLLIGGTTTHAANLFSLTLIGDEWASANPYDVRRDHLKYGGGLNGIFVLVDGVSVFDDGATDQLIGGDGQDWFWADPVDILNLAPGEVVK